LNILKAEQNRCTRQAKIDAAEDRRVLEVAFALREQTINTQRQAIAEQYRIAGERLRKGTANLVKGNFAQMNAMQTQRTNLTNSLTQANMHHIQGQFGLRQQLAQRENRLGELEQEYQILQAQRGFFQGVSPEGKADDDYVLSASASEVTSKYLNLEGLEIELSKKGCNSDYKPATDGGKTGE